MAQIKIIHEDNHLLVAEKPQGMLSQGDATGDEDILSYLKKYIKEKYNKPGEAYLGLVHRLDRPTGGLMVFARTSKAARRLQQQIKTSIFRKTYLAVLCGHPDQNGILENYLIKNDKTNTVSISDSHDGKYAKLCYKIKNVCQDYSLAEIRLETGRSHQIRVQFANIGTPLYGDVKYGNIRGHLALWAYKLEFYHPVTNELLTFTSNPPDTKPWTYFRPENKI